MAYRASYRMTTDEQDVILRFNRKMIGTAALRKLLDYLEMESIRQRSQLSEEQAAELAAEIDRSVWSGIKSMFVEA